MEVRAFARVVFGLSWFSIGCVGHVGEDASRRDEVDNPSVQGLTLTRHDGSALEGTFVLDAGTIHFAATAPAPDAAQLVFRINGKVLQYEGLASSEQRNGFFRVDADVAFSAADRALSAALSTALLDELGDDATQLSLFESSVPKMAQFIAAQRDDVSVASSVRLEFASSAALRNKSLRDDGVVCVKRGASMTVQYDDRQGAVKSVPVVVGANWGRSACGSGDYACMGRCSAGCGGFGGGWTLDCLEHDACSHDMCASGGSRDPNCGDEYNNARSDIFSSCSG